MRLSRRAAIAAGLFVVTVAATAALRIRPGRDVRAAPGPVPSLAAIDTLAIRRAGVETVIRHDAGIFTVTAPVAGPADEQAAAAAFGALAALDLVAPVSDREARHRELEVDDGRGVRVTARRGGQTLAELVVGKVVDDGTMLRIGAGAAVWRAAGDLRAVFDRSPGEWRDRSVARFSPRDAARIEIAARDGARIALARAPEADEAGVVWRVASSSLPIGRLDARAPRMLVETLSSLSASGFGDGVTPAAAGLAPPALTVSVGLADGSTVTVRLGDVHGKDEVFVAAADRDPVFLVKQFNVDRIGLRPLQFRDKTLCDISDGDIIAFGVTRGPASYAVERRVAGWQATAPRGLAVDSEKVAPLASVFRGWTAPRVAEHPPPDAVASPRLVIVGRSARARCTIRVGRELPDGSGYFVQTPTSRDVLVVPKWMIDRIAVPLGQIRKA